MDMKDNIIFSYSYLPQMEGQEPIEKLNEGIVLFPLRVPVGKTLTYIQFNSILITIGPMV
jgi:hypothetical protein